MNYGEHNFIEITQQPQLRVAPVALVVSSQSSSTCRANRAVLFDKLDTAKLHGLDTSNVARQSRTCRVVSRRAKWNLGHTNLIDIQLNETMRIISDTLLSTPIPWILVLSHILPPQLRCEEAISKLLNKVEFSGHVPLFSDIFHHLGCHQGILSGGEIHHTTASVSSQWRDNRQLITVINALTGRRSHSPTSRFPSSPTLLVIIEPFSDRTGPLRHVLKNGCLPFNITISSIPACWPKSTMDYNVYTLQTKLMLIDWHHMAHSLEAYETLHYISIMQLKRKSLQWRRSNCSLWLFT